MHAGGWLSSSRTLTTFLRCTWTSTNGQHSRSQCCESCKEFQSIDLLYWDHLSNALHVACKKTISAYVFRGFGRPVTGGRELLCSKGHRQRGNDGSPAAAATTSAFPGPALSATTPPRPCRAQTHPGNLSTVYTKYVFGDNPVRVYGIKIWPGLGLRADPTTPPSNSIITSSAPSRPTTTTGTGGGTVAEWG